ncbi:hypothetical protein SEA_GIBBLES_71 [Gordonia phage Gibbles]|nr:hypothetical protein SEA_GIBBLES_71 [Gordonia phage Gibbles]
MNVRVIIDNEMGLRTEVEIDCNFLPSDVKEKLDTAVVSAYNAYNTAYLAHGPIPDDKQIGS